MADTGVERPRPHERLWTPWRMHYIAGGASEQGCIFCNRRDADDEVGALVLHRGERAYVIMNLFPYNTGHVMLVPNVHAASLDDLDDPTVIEMALLAPKVVTALRRVLNCDGFNLGLNLGAVAGAGVAEHLHQHIVPRWTGDANFMPILASTTVMPELIPVTYVKVRAELHRELGAVANVAVVILTEDDRTVVLRNGRLPIADAVNDAPLWRSALEFARAVAPDAAIVAWAGSNDGEESPPPPYAALAVRARTVRPDDQWGAVPIELALEGRLGTDVRGAVERALRSLKVLDDVTGTGHGQAQPT